MDRFRLEGWRQFNDDDERKVLLSIPPLRERAGSSCLSDTALVASCSALPCPAADYITQETERLQEHAGGQDEAAELSQAEPMTTMIEVKKKKNHNKALLSRR